jgi:hypothetical protein
MERSIRRSWCVDLLPLVQFIEVKQHQMFEDDGSIASGSTSAAYDSERGTLFMHGRVLPDMLRDGDNVVEQDWLPLN